MPVKALSGGEQNRAVLAKLLSKPANLLVLDEPTNDLDIETLELLEEILLGFEGTVLLVSHDREFMDNVVTSLVVLDGRGGISEHVGGYSDWEGRGGTLSEAQPVRTSPPGPGPEPLPGSFPAPFPAPTPPGSTRAAALRPGPAEPRKRKLSYKEQRELAALPAQIEALEQQQLRLEKALAERGFYQSSPDEIQRVTRELADAQLRLEAAFTRWNQLESGG
jgi:ATP-binding cassette subfamily F protein uup